ncbi:MAG: biotin--[acetyl-CoA-carboxylase] ligase [Lentisphaerae bacterium]|nr:biotin--[acetyl-CoA-carboxylase] ligase [Lentisphaerota bacterium]
MNTLQTAKPEHGKGLWGQTLYLFRRLPSTNNWCLSNIENLNHGDIVQTTDQTDGYGRFGRPWISPKHTCVTLSVILNPDKLAGIDSTRFSQIAALAVQTILVEFDIPAVVKWPNDVLVGKAKIAGILSETHEKSGYVVLGIGLNVNIPPTTTEIMQTTLPAVSMSAIAKKKFSLLSVRDRLIARLSDHIAAAQSNSDHIALEWKRNDALAGSKLIIESNNSVMIGKYAGMDSLGRLVLIDTTGQKRCFWSGDVSILKHAGN